jgi:hypothetical protein
MNIFKKYKSNSIAVLVSVAFYTVFFVLLAIIPKLDSDQLADDDKDSAVQFELMPDAEMDTPPPTDIPNPNDKKAPSDQKAQTNSQPQDLAKAMDEIKDFEPGEDDDVTNVVRNQDSVMLEQMKKTMQVLKEVVLMDSLAKNPIQQENTKKVQQALTEKTKFTQEDFQFIRSNYRAIYNLKKVYPYVLKTKEVVDKLNAKLATIKDGGERRRLIKATEKELFQQYEQDVRKMSYSQGKLLLKLLARETNESAYGLIKTYKGGIPATFWYGVGLLFHENLKAKYDSIGEDKVLEQIVIKYKKGKI